MMVKELQLNLIDKDKQIKEFSSQKLNLNEKNENLNNNEILEKKDNNKESEKNSMLNNNELLNSNKELNTLKLLEEEKNKNKILNDKINENNVIIKELLNEKNKIKNELQNLKSKNIVKENIKNKNENNEEKETDKIKNKEKHDKNEFNNTIKEEDENQENIQFNSKVTPENYQILFKKDLNNLTWYLLYNKNSTDQKNSDNYIWLTSNKFDFTVFPKFEEKLADDPKSLQMLLEETFKNNEKKQDKISQLELENRKLKEQIYKNRTTTFSNNSLSKNNLFMNKFNDFNILNKNPNISNNSSAVNKENKSHNLEFDENVINKLLSQLNEKDQTIGLLQNEIKQLKKSNNPFGDFSIIGSGEKFNENFIEEDINFIEQINKSQKDINKLNIDNKTLNQSAGKLPNENIQKNNNDNKKDITNIKENNNNNNNNNSKNIKIGSNIFIGNVDNEELYNEEEYEKNIQQNQLNFLKDELRNVNKKIENIKYQIIKIFENIKYSKKIDFFIKQICQLLDLNPSTYFKQMKQK